MEIEIAKKLDEILKALCDSDYGMLGEQILNEQETYLKLLTTVLVYKDGKQNFSFTDLVELLEILKKDGFAEYSPFSARDYPNNFKTNIRLIRITLQGRFFINPDPKLNPFSGGYENRLKKERAEKTKEEIERKESKDIQQGILEVNKKLTNFNFWIMVGALIAGAYYLLEIIKFICE